MLNLTYALAEEIGDPDLFVGRRAEMERLLDWAAGVKRRISLSTGILARRKKGKTALLQRFYNVLYTRNDPQLIPFYYRIPEERVTKTVFAAKFYRRLLTQYFAFTTRTPGWANKVLPLADLKELAAEDPHVADDIRIMEDILENFPGEAWEQARDAGHRISTARDVRIVQILDEFQYMNRWIGEDHDPKEDAKLCYSYMGTAESKFSPQIVAGSYIGWLGAILRHMTGRYDEWYLEGLDDGEALEAVYKYATVYQVPITGETAPYVAEVCDNDPFYIASTIRNRIAEKDLTTREGVRDALTLETTLGKGAVARMWNEYLLAAFPRINGATARSIVLYLARHEPEERTRKQIRKDLKIDLPDDELEVKLHQLVKADILADGSTNYRYRGLGDRIFAMVFRRIYGEEIEDLKIEEIEDEFKGELAKTRRQAARYKGSLAEYKVCYLLLMASLRGATLADVVKEGAPEGIALGPFKSLRKAHVDLGQEVYVEIDVHAVNEDPDGVDLMVEVKNWDRPVTADAARRFV
ncbi:MAG: hypothetical protein ACYTG4_14560, partial [Planctomycetota bacterium]